VGKDNGSERTEGMNYATWEKYRDVPLAVRLRKEVVR
jgi:hypothetical protein